MTDVIAFDPGLTTGWARLNEAHRFTSGQDEWYPVFHTFYETVRSGTKPIVVCEDFIYTKETLKKSRQTWSTEGIGLLKFLAVRYQLDLTIQAPADAKTFSTKQKLERLGWWTPGQDHANDASRHLLLYGVANGLVRLSDII